MDSRRQAALRGDARREPGVLPGLRPPGFADLLRRYRAAAGLTQEELAERATLSARAISDLERGLKTRPQRETIRLLAEALGLAAEERARLVAAARPLAIQRPLPPAANPGNLPAPPTPLIGREAAVAAAVAALREPGTRLLTITGPGGVGKSRLALAVAELLRPDFPDGVFSVPLAATADPALVPAAVARPLGIAERGGLPLHETLRDVLREKRLLLLLDNVEHLLPAAVTLVEELLASCRGVKVLATSRAALDSRWGREYPLPPLALPPAGGPPDLAALARAPAVTLFVARAAAVRRDFRLTPANALAVAAICRRLDGLPLALELAAARLRLLSPRALLERLDEPFRLLSGAAPDLPARQRTMRAAIAWSYDLLDPDERRLFRRLAVFAGGCTIEALEAVCTEPDATSEVLDLAEGLVAQSLVRPADSADDEPRLTLFETIREYAAEQLAAHGEEAATREAHAAHYLALAEEASGRMTGAVPAGLLGRLDREHDNLRAALRWLVARRDAARALRLAGALRRFWFLQGHITEGRGWYDTVLALPADADDPAIAALQAGALDGASRLAYLQSDYDSVVALGERALAIRRDLGDRAGIAAVLNTLGAAAHERDDDERARACHEESLALRRALGNQGDVAGSLNNLGLLAVSRGDYARARACYAEALTIHRADGDQLSIALVLLNLAETVEYGGEARRAVALYEESLALYRALGNSEGVALASDNLGVTLRALGEYRRAAALHEESLARWRTLGTRWRVAVALTNLGATLHQLGEHDRAAMLHEESLVLFRAVGNRWGAALALNNLGRCRWTQGARARAVELHHESLATYREIDNAGGIIGVLVDLARDVRALGDPDRALVLLREGLTRCRQIGVQNRLPAILEVRVAVAADRGQFVEAAHLCGAAAALRDRLGTPLPTTERPDHEQVLAALRAALGDAPFTAALAAGRALDPDTAAAEALAVATVHHYECRQ